MPVKPLLVQMQLCSFLWANGFPLLKVSGHGIDPLPLTTLRGSMGGGALAIWITFSGQPSTARPRMAGLDGARGTSGHRPQLADGIRADADFRRSHLDDPGMRIAGTIILAGIPIASGNRRQNSSHTELNTITSLKVA